MSKEIVRIITCFILGWDLNIYKDCVIIDIKDACRTKKEPIVLADIILLMGLFIFIISISFIFDGDEAATLFVIMYTIYVYLMKFALKE